MRTPNLKPATTLNAIWPDLGEITEMERRQSSPNTPRLSRPYTIIGIAVRAPLALTRGKIAVSC